MIAAGNQEAGSKIWELNCKTDNKNHKPGEQELLRSWGFRNQHLSGSWEPGGQGQVACLGPHNRVLCCQVEASNQEFRKLEEVGSSGPHRQVCSWELAERWGACKQGLGDSLQAGNLKSEDNSWCQKGDEQDLHACWERYEVGVNGGWDLHSLVMDGGWDPLGSSWGHAQSGYYLASLPERRDQHWQIHF